MRTRHYILTGIIAYFVFLITTVPAAPVLGMFKDRMRCSPESADWFKACANDGLEWLDALLEGKDYLCGDRITVGDLVLFCCVDFAAGVGQKVDPSLKNVTALMERVGSRPSAEASLHPAAGKVKMKG